MDGSLGEAQTLAILIEATIGWADGYRDRVRDAVRQRVTVAGKLDRVLMDAEQHRVHGLAWVATYAEAFRQVGAWRGRLIAEGRFTETEALLIKVLFAEYAAQLVGGVPMNQGEIIRPSDFDIELEPGPSAAWRALAGQAEKTALSATLAHALGAASVEDSGLDETHLMIRDQFHAFAEEKVAPYAHGWHLRDELIPLPLVQELGDLGVFGLTIPEAYGGSGLGKTAMCVVSEVLSRGYIGVGSLGTRSEIAAELILCGSL